MRVCLGAWVVIGGALGSCSLVGCTTNNNTYESPTGGSGGAAGGNATAGAPSTPNNAAGQPGSAAGEGGLSTGGTGGDAPGGAGGTSAMGGSGGAITGPTSSYEAEDAFNGGTATLATTSKGFSGAGYVDALASTGAKVIFAVNAATDAASSLSLQYSAPAAKKVAVYLNGAKVSDETLPATTGGAFGTHASTLTLRTGLNTIEYVNEDGSSGAVSMDKLDITNGAARPARGAIQPFTEYEAEAGTTTGTAVGPDRTFGTVAAEASGRKAVHLDATGKYVEWTTTVPANALVIRYSMPDAPDGGGTTGNVSLYVDGKKSKALPVTSKYAWVYGAYTYKGKPSDGSPHRYFDETRYLVGDIAKGAKLRLQRDDGDADITIDLVDIEVAPAAYAKPIGALSLTDFGAKAGDGNDDASALRDAISAAKAQNKELFVPPGSYNLNSQVDVDHVTIRGAGPWYSVFVGAAPKSGFNGAGGGAKLLDFAIMSELTYRDDSELDSGLDGAWGTDLLVQNLWIEHTKAGVWLSGPTKGAYVVGCRIHDTFADGVNLYAGTSYTAIEHTHVRNSGDDALAMYSKGTVNESNRFRFDTVRLPMLANGAAIYGGSNNSIQDLDIADTVVAAAGIAVSTRFDGTTPFAGTTVVARNTLTRTGGHEPNWVTDLGGLWIYADPSAPDISAPISVSDLQVSDSTFQGLLISFQKSVTNLTLDKVTLDGAGSYGIEINTTGSAKFAGVVVKNAKTASNIGGTFSIAKGDGNTGW